MLAILFLLPCWLAAQQTPFFHFFQQNWTFVNPAAVDKSFIFKEKNPFIAHAGYRQQWIGIEDAPRIYFAGFEHEPVDENFKWGFQFFGDQSGTLNTHGGYFNYSYSLKFANTRNRRLYFGINAGVVRYGIALNQVRLQDPTDPVTVDARGTVYFDASIGVFYQDNQKFYAGISIPQTFSLDLAQPNGEGGFTPERIQHLYLVLGGFLGASNRRRIYSTDFMFEPSLWVKYTPGLGYFSVADNLPISADFQLRAYYQKILWFGAGYGTNRHLAVDFGINKTMPAIIGDTEDRLRVGIGYTVPFQATGLDLGHSLEINLAYSWN